MSVGHAGFQLEANLSFIGKRYGNPLLLQQIGDRDDGLRRDIGRLFGSWLRRAEPAYESAEEIGGKRDGRGPVIASAGLGGLAGGRRIASYGACGSLCRFRRLLYLGIVLCLRAENPLDDVFGTFRPGVGFLAGLRPARASARASSSISFSAALARSAASRAASRCCMMV